MRTILRTFLILSGLFPMPSARASWWKNFCERYLVEPDYSQYENLTTEQLIQVYFVFKKQNHYSPALAAEINKRLAKAEENGDREYLEKTLGEERSH